MTQPHGTPHWPPAFKPGSDVSMLTRGASPPRVTVNRTPGIIERKIQTASTLPDRVTRDAAPGLGPTFSRRPSPALSKVNVPTPPPVYRPAQLQLRRLSPVSVQRHSAPQLQPNRFDRRAVVQRYCGAPGCNDPHCHDVSNHGFGRVYDLRGRTLYHGGIDQGDIGGGTNTNQTTRRYVNSPSTVYPQQVSIEYSERGSASGSGGRSEFINQPLAPGQRADAGHIFGNQYGGYGNQSAAVFPQHPQTNRGNYYNGQPTRPLWREHEDQVRGLAEQGAIVRNTVTLHERPHLYYGNSCRRCHLANPQGAAHCQGCGRLL